MKTQDRLHAWILASRPRTLPASIAPVIVGAAVAAREGAFHLPATLVALAAALLIQIGSNFANDLGDYYRGADRPGRLGPTRVTSAGLLTARQVQGGMVAVFGAATICGLYLVALGGWPILAVGVLAIAAALTYTIGPWPFGYYGLGDLAVFIFFGLAAVVGTAYVQTHHITPLALAAAVPMGCLVTAILVVNNLRDIATDRAAGKRTLAVRLGRRGTQIEYILLLAVAYAVPIVLWLGLGLRPWVLLPLFTLPPAARLARAILTEEGAALNRALAGTAQLAVWFGVALAIGTVA
ncbi:MAG: 1,4-dihydroxy-2-naphthoate polyprenyltransferase [Anaerolineae bacterium]